MESRAVHDDLLHRASGWKMGGGSGQRGLRRCPGGSRTDPGAAGFPTMAGPDGSIPSGPFFAFALRRLGLFSFCYKIVQVR